MSDNIETSEPAGKVAKDKGKKSKGKDKAKPERAEQVEALPAYVPEPEAASVPPVGRSIPLWLLVVSGVLAVGLLATTTLAVVQWKRADDAEKKHDEVQTRFDQLQGIELEKGDAVAVGRQFVQEFLTYDYNNLDASRQKVIDLTTPEFGQQYAKAFDEGLRPVLTAAQALATAAIRDAVIIRLDGDSAVAVVVADQDFKSTTGTGKKLGSYFKVELQRIDGNWKVKAVAVLGVEENTPTPTAPAPTEPPAGG